MGDLDSIEKNSRYLWIAVPTALWYHTREPRTGCLLGEPRTGDKEKDCSAKLRYAT
jgi:hypothetical protein